MKLIEIMIHNKVCKLLFFAGGGISISTTPITASRTFFRKEDGVEVSEIVDTTIFYHKFGQNVLNVVS